MEEPQLDPNSIILSTRLYDAALKGDVNSLHNLLQEDQLILDRCIIEKSDRFIQSPLHVSSNLGHLEFTTELLRLKPELAEQLDQSTRSSALHLGSTKGHLDVVKALLEVKPGMCLARDQNGRNPVHVAAISSQLDVLDLLVRTNPLAARERTNCGETVLHLCVKYAQFEALEYLVNAIDDSELLNSKDADDNTVLHLLVVAKQLEAVKILVANKKVQQSSINKNGLTPIDWLIQNGKSMNDKEIMRTLKRAKSFEAKGRLKQRDKDDKWLKKQSNALMVVASLIATMAFQIGVNPPGGVWQDDSNPNQPDRHVSHFVGTSIMADRDSHMFGNLQTANTVSLISSLSVVLLLVSGISCKRFFVVLLIIIMWVAVATTTLTYYFSLTFLTKEFHGGSGPGPGPGPRPGPGPGPGKADNISVSPAATLLICWVMLIVFGYIIRILFKPMKNMMLQLLLQVKKMLRKWFHKEYDSSSSVVP